MENINSFSKRFHSFPSHFGEHREKVTNHLCIGFNKNKMAKFYLLSTSIKNFLFAIVLTTNLFAIFPAFSNCHEYPNTITPFEAETKDIFTNIFSGKSNTRQNLRKQLRAQLRRPERSIIEESRKNIQPQQLVRDKSTDLLKAFFFDSFFIIGGDERTENLLSCCYKKVYQGLLDMFVEYSTDIAIVEYLDVQFSKKDCKRLRRRT